MKHCNIIVYLLALIFSMFVESCSDLSGIESDINLLSKRVSTLEDALDVLKKAQLENKTINSVVPSSNGEDWIVTFTDKQEVVFSNGGNDAILLRSIDRDTNSGIITLTMSDGQIFKFNLNVSFPTSIVSLIDDKIFISENSTCTFKVIVNPSDAVIKTDEGNGAFSLSFQSKPEVPFVAIDSISPAKDDKGNIMAGLYFITIKDLGVRTNYTDEFSVQIESKDSSGDSIKIRSESIAIEWCNDKSLYDFRIGDCMAKYDGDFITFNIPFGSTDFSKLKPTFKTDGKVYVNEVEQKSGASEVDLSMPVEYTIVSPNGEKKVYFVSIVFGDLPMVYLKTINSHPIDSRDTYQENVTVYVTNSEYKNKYNNVRIKGRGNSTWNYMEKHCYTMKLDKKSEFIGLKKHKTFALIGNYTDKTLIRNYMTYMMGREIFNRTWSPSTRNVHYIVNGEYLGLYLIVETIKIDKNRVDIPNIEDCESISEVDNYGFIMEFDKRADDNFCFTTPEGYCISLKEPDGADIDDSKKSYIKKTIQNAENALFSSDFWNPSSSNYYGNYLDIDSFVDWLLVQEVTKITDSNIARAYSSCYMYFDPKDHKFHMGPIWDYDVAYGNYAYENSGSESIYTYGWWAGKGAWLGRLLADNSFQKKVKQRWTAKKAELDIWASSRTQEAATAIEKEASINFQRWPILGTYVWQNAPGSTNRKTYQSEVDYLKEWMKYRISWLDSQISRW